MMIDRHRYVIVKKTCFCWECQEPIEKKTICINNKEKFYHDVCYSKLRMLLRKLYGLPHTTMSTSAKLSNKWSLENFTNECMI